MRPAIVCGIVTGEAPASYWLTFPPVTVLEVFAKVNSAQFPCLSKVADWSKARHRLNE